MFTGTLFSVSSIRKLANLTLHAPLVHYVPGRSTITLRYCNCSLGVCREVFEFKFNQREEMVKKKTVELYSQDWAVKYVTTITLSARFVIHTAA